MRRWWDLVVRSFGAFGPCFFLLSVFVLLPHALGCLWHNSVEAVGQTESVVR